MREEILKIIKEIIKEKRDAKRFPAIALDVELSQAIRAETLKILRSLWKDEVIDIGRTLNHNFVEIIKPVQKEGTGK